MSSVTITFRGVDGALKELRALPDQLREAAKEAAQRTAESTRKRAITLTTQRYNLDAEPLEPYVTTGYTGTGGRTDGWASVRLLARPIPVSEFKPQVRMRSFRLVSRGTKPKTYTRRLPTIYVQRFRSGSPKHLHPYFPLYTRENGPLPPADSVRKRVGKTKIGRVVNGVGYEGNKLTGVRYYTFPKQFLREIRPQLVRFVGDSGQIELRSAFRKRFKGQRVLRGPR